jgi:Arc/MetJ family transcription regulator
MATNIGMDERLLAEAQRIGKQPTKKATVNEALAEYIKHRKRLKSLELIGKVDFNSRYNYKKARRQG